MNSLQSTGCRDQAPPHLPNEAARIRPLAQALRPLSDSLHRHRFREVARLIDIGAHEDSGVVGKQLDRQREDHRRDDLVDDGRVIVAMVGSFEAAAPASSVMKMMRPPRAATSCMFETVLSKKRS